MAPLILLILGAAAVGIGLAAAGKGEAKPGGVPAPSPTPKPSPTGGIDVGQLLADTFNAMGSATLTPGQLQRIKDATAALGVDDRGMLTARPSPQAIQNLVTLAAELKKEGAPTVVVTGLVALATAAAGLPQGATTMSGSWAHGPWQEVQGPWHYLGSLTEQNRKTEPSLPAGSYTDISGFSDWWDGFVQKWSANWWRR
jgi:hypothetical protein